MSLHRYFSRLLGALTFMAVFNQAVLAAAGGGSVGASAGAGATVSSSASASASASFSSEANVLIPFYAHPSGGAWEPLQQVVSTNPNTQFTVIINPSSGPGSTNLPDEAFLSEVPKLNLHGNVRIIGYVSTQYGGRDLSEVQKDIATYAGWPSASGNAEFAVHGIFLDEASAEYDENALTYYRQLTSCVKQESGFGPDKYVVTNPGTVPHSAYLEIPDMTVVVETTYDEFKSLVASNKFEALSGVSSSQLAAIIQSVPSDVDLNTVISEANHISGSVYISHTSSYTTYDPVLSEVVQGLAGCSSCAA